MSYYTKCECFFRDVDAVHVLYYYGESRDEWKPLLNFQLFNAAQFNATEIQLFRGFSTIFKCRNEKLWV